MDESVPKNQSSYDVKTEQAFFKPKEYLIPRLPLLDDMASLVRNLRPIANLKNVKLIGVQHILETTVTLFDSLNQLGIAYENMYFSGKCYSTAREVEQQVRKRGIKLMPSNKPDEPGQYEKYCRKGIELMWEKFIKDIKNQPVDMIIILDEGGRCLEGMPEFIGFKYRVAAIEQTRAGLYSESLNLLPFPLIDVASCAVKRILEPPLIAEAILNRFKKLLERLKPHQNTVFGIIGNGAIGYGLCQYLLSQGYSVIVYDQNESSFQNIYNTKFYRLGRIEEVISGANYIFGCTGKDVTEGIDVLSIVKKDKVFISCTSEDKEFKSLLRTIASQDIVSIDTLSDIVCLSKNRSRVIILQGGFPFNFDRNPWNVPAKDIEVTQGLLLGACLQAISCATKPIDDGKTVNSGSKQTLDPYIQRFVALHWLRRQTHGRYDPKVMETFEDINWITKNSGSSYCKNDEIATCFLSAKAEKSPPIRAKL